MIKILSYERSRRDRAECKCFLDEYRTPSTSLLLLGSDGFSANWKHCGIASHVTSRVS